MNASTQAHTEYRVLKRAVKALRENFMAGDLSGFESYDALVEAIRTLQSRMFAIVASVR